jgi:hypothetical protein
MILQELWLLNGSACVHAAQAPSIPSEDKLTTTTSYDTVEGLKKLNQRLKQVLRESL